MGEELKVTRKDLLQANAATQDMIPDLADLEKYACSRLLVVTVA